MCRGSVEISLSFSLSDSRNKKSSDTSSVRSVLGFKKFLNLPQRLLLHKASGLPEFVFSLHQRLPQFVYHIFYHI